MPVFVGVLEDEADSSWGLCLTESTVYLGKERTVGLVAGDEAIAKTLVVLHEIFPRPPGVPTAVLSAEGELLLELTAVHRASSVLADVELCLLLRGVLAPPVRELSVVGSLMTDIPVDLRDDVVDPALTHPVQDVCIQVIISLQARGLAAFA